MANRALIERIRRRHDGEPGQTPWPEWAHAFARHQRDGCTGPWMQHPCDPVVWICEVCGSEDD